MLHVAKCFDNFFAINDKIKATEIFTDFHRRQNFNFLDAAKLVIFCEMSKEKAPKLRVKLRGVCGHLNQGASL